MKNTIYLYRCMSCGIPTARPIVGRKWNCHSCYGELTCPPKDVAFTWKEEPVLLPLNPIRTRRVCTRCGSLNMKSSKVTILGYQCADCGAHENWYLKVLPRSAAYIWMEIPQ